jgi:hypothetical protein
VTFKLTVFYRVVVCHITKFVPKHKEAEGVIYQACRNSNVCSTDTGVRNKLLNDAVLTGVYREGCKALIYWFTDNAGVFEHDIS